VELQILVGVFAVGNVEDAQLHIAPVGHRLRFANGPLRRLYPSGIGIKVENDLFRLGVAQQLAHLGRTQGRAQGGDGVGDARRMQGNHVKVTFHHNGAVGLGDRPPRLVEAKQGLSFVEQLRIGGIEVLRFVLIA
jgi:hypothetical protein